MSLLIKALQKAEDKKTADDTTGASSDGLSLEPKSSGSAQAHPTTASRVEPTASFASSYKPQQAAASVFSAKRPLDYGLGSKKILLIAIASLLLLLLIGMQVYSYLDSLDQPVALASRPSTAPMSQPVPEAQPQVVTEADGTTQVLPAAEEPIEQAGLAPDVEQPVTGTATAAEAAGKSNIMPPAAENHKASPQTRKVLMGASVPAASDDKVKVTRNVVEVGINPDLAIAYRAFMAGDDGRAQTYYRRALQADVRNVDALLGMAAIAARQGRAQDAAGWYGKVLEIDPRNSIAQAALISGYAQVDPVGAESRIKNLLAITPDAANLHAALGSLYAEREEWAQAQQAYFQAHHFAPANADHAFNLAVSLDHLGKAALALQYYQQSLELLSRSGSGNIDRAQLESRILQLQ